MISAPSKEELLGRIERLFAAINENDSDWNAAFIVDKINQYYLTGTMQEGVFILKRDGSYAYFARKSYERAKMESPLDNIYPMNSYKDAAAVIGSDCPKAYIETETMTYAMLQRLKKYFTIEQIVSIDSTILNVRSVKSPYELACMEESGKQHKHLLEDVAPGLLYEGMNEAELTAKLYDKMIEIGYHGVTRFSMFQTEIIIGQLGFGDSSLFPGSFDGPGGMRGICNAVPLVGSRNRTLKKGDLVFIDIGYGVEGYHTDRTQIYMFGQNPSDELVSLHRACMKIQKEAAAMLKPGNIPSEIYNTIISGLDNEMLTNFMGPTYKKIKFLGHGVGLRVDEYPVIANGFNAPIKENMTIAIEPKKAIEGIGLVGVEDTYVVTPTGGRCITGGEKDIIVVK